MATDLTTGTSMLDVGSQLTAGSQLDTSSVDKNLRAIRQVEGAWRPPALTDNIRLDLATIPGVGHSAISQFLAGLDRDLHNENDEDPVDTSPDMPQLRVMGSGGEFGELGASGFQQISSALNQLRGMRPSEVLDADATQRWKLRAIEKGFMAPPENGVVDSTWSPDMYAVQREMQFAEYDDRARGDRFGALPLTSTKDRKGVLDILNDWTSPSGLMRMAVDLDMFWDFGQISKEFSSWGDKWSKVGKSEGPLDFAKNLFDAVTGPIDDIVVPIINDVLLFTGIGVGTNFARLGLAARSVHAAETFTFASKLYEVPKIGTALSKIFPAVTEAGELGRASWTAQKLMKAGGTAGKVGDALAAWRSWAPVVGTRGVVQTGMRLGLVSQAEQRFLPGYEGSSLGDIGAVNKVADEVFRNPWVSNLGDVLFAPYTILKPGTFTGAIKGATLGGAAALGTVPGRAVVGGVVGAGVGALAGDDGGDVLEGAAIGAGVGAALPAAGRALKGFGEARVHLGGHELKVPIFSRAAAAAGSIMELSSWERVADNQALTGLFMDAVRTKMSEPEWKVFEEKIGEHGFLQAFADHVGTDKAGAGAAMMFVTLSAAIDRTASLQAIQSGAKQGSPAYFERFFLARNKLVAQMRTFGENPSAEELAWAVARRESRSGRNLKRRVAKLQEAFETDPSRIEQALMLHNEQAQLTMKQLLSTDNLPLEGLDDVSRANLGPLFSDAREANLKAMTGYIANSLDTFGDWGKYSESLQSLNMHIQSGVFNDAALAPAMSYMGTNAKLNILEALPENEALIRDTDLNLISQHIHDIMFLDEGVSLEAARAAGFYYSPLAREITPHRGRITLMRSSSVTKQEVLQERDMLTRVLHAYDNLQPALRAASKAQIDVSRLAELDSRTVSAALRAAGMTGDLNSAKALTGLRRVLIHIRDTKKIDVSDPAVVLKQFAEDLAVDARWAEKFQQPIVMSTDQGTAVTGVELLRRRRKELHALSKRTAAEIDMDGLVAQTRAARGDAAADELQAFVDHVRANDYKIVHGQEFLMPSELADTTVFGDINRRHMNAMTLGNFFGRRQPAELALKVQMARARAIARNLQKIPGYENVGPMDERVQYLVQDLYRLVLDPELERNSMLLDDIAHQTFRDKIGTSLKTGGQPRNLQDLGLAKNQSRVVAALTKAGYSEQEALAAWRGVKEGRYAEWRDQGLYAIEAKLRGRSQLVDALRILGGSPDAARLKRAVGGGLAGGFVGGIVGQATAEDGSAGRGEWLQGAAAGFGLGAVARAGAGLVTDAVLAREATSSWARYGYVADGLAALRDRMRFSLSPFFDASRYTEAWMLGQIAAPKRVNAPVLTTMDNARIVMPFNQSPKQLARRLTKELGSRAAADAKLEEIDRAWTAASNGVFDVNLVEEAQRQFQEIGLLGFNPTAWMKSSFHYLRETGMDDRAAYEAIRDMYTYGTTSRSAFEQSVNFILFPFSFQKKTLTHAAQWISDDLTRAVLLHDAVKTFELLDENYDLSAWAEEHLPVLQKLKQLNMFAFGLSPGRLGGINAPFVDAVLGDPFAQNPNDRKGLVFTLFSPVGVNVGAGITPEELTKLGKRLIPAINDIDQMVQNLKSQGHVAFDPAHKVRWAQSRDAGREWADYRKGVDAALKEHGISWYELHNNDALTDLKAQYEKKRTELELQYPGWVQGRVEAMGDTAALGQERAHRINMASYFPAEASPTDFQFAEFERMLAQEKEILDMYGLSWEDMDPFKFNQIRGVAMQMVQQNPGFQMVYDKFYERTFGPITSEVA